jgi:hypothetical protein
VWLGMGWVLFGALQGGRDISVIHNFRAGSGVESASYPLVTGVLPSGLSDRRVKLHLHSSSTLKSLDSSVGMATMLRAKRPRSRPRDFSLLHKVHPASYPAGILVPVSEHGYFVAS